MAAKHIYEFGAFRLDPDERQLLRDGEALALAPKAFEVLLALVENSGRLVRKDELMKRLWPDAFVEEANLPQNIAAVRRVLGDGNGSGKYIETVPKAGYRFAAAVKHVTFCSDAAVEKPSTKPTQAPRWPTVSMALAGFLVCVAVLSLSWLRHRAAERSGTSATRKMMLVVLPFDNLSPDQSQDYFAAGMTEELITQLGRYNPERLGVIARTSAEQYRHKGKVVSQVGRELGVDYVVEGSARREGQQVRITVQLIQVRDQTHLWAKEYDREMRQVLKLEEEVAADVAHEISTELSAAGPIQPKIRAVDSVAYDYYLQGRYLLKQRSEDSERKALAHFELAVSSDPTFAAAYTGIADSYVVLTIDAGLVPDEAFRKAVVAAQRALELDGSQAEAHASLAMLKMTYDRDWDGAEREFRRAVELNPNYTLAHQWFAEYWMTKGDLAQALNEMTIAQTLDPLSPMIATEVGWVFYFGQQQDKAIEQYRRVLSLNPNFTYAKFCLGLAFEEKGEYGEAIRLLSEAAVAWPNDAGTMAALSHAYSSAGDRKRAQELLSKMLHERERRHVEPLFLADAYAGLGNTDEAFQWLNTYASNPTMYIASLKIKADPRLNNLRRDPRYHELLQKLRLPV